MAESPAFKEMSPAFYEKQAEYLIVGSQVAGSARSHTSLI
jgi:hypothetical protein